MKLAFCNNCNNLMKISNDLASCACGFKRKLNLNEKKHTETLDKQEQLLIDATKTGDFANYPHTCKKCGHNMAELIMTPPPYSDADYNIRFKCGKCGNIERQRLCFT